MRLNGLLKILSGKQLQKLIKDATKPIHGLTSGLIS
jgi:hypothetical protein